MSARHTNATVAHFANPDSVPAMNEVLLRTSRPLRSIAANVLLGAAALAPLALHGGPVAPQQQDVVGTQRAFQPPPSAHLAFEVKGKVSGIRYSANARLEWQIDGQRYRAFQEVRLPLLGSRSQLSTGLVGAEQLRPERFEDSHRNRKLRFDPQQGTVLYHQATEPSPIPANTQDRLSVFFQLASLVAAQPQRFSAGQQVQIPTVTFNKQDNWIFEVAGTETLQLPAGALQTIRLRRLTRKDRGQTEEIWLAPELHYLPVRIVVTEDDGDVIDLKLQKHTSAPAA